MLFDKVQVQQGMPRLFCFCMY